MGILLPSHCHWFLQKNTASLCPWLCVYCVRAVQIVFRSKFGSEAAWGVVTTLSCDIWRVVLPWTNHPCCVLPFDNIESIRNNSPVVWSCGYCVAAIHVAFLFDFWVWGRRGVLFGRYSVIHVEECFHWPSTHSDCPLITYKAFKTPLQL